ncbi:hypothetical protein D1007_18687 [Hordeum vulgare]|nr:hypothetical protein D1007_18687 [Hordeum vulgare]
MDYVGGDVAYSVIERDKLSLQEVKGFLADHLTVKESMKYYFLMPGRDLINGLLFLHDDVSCMSMSDHTTDGGVADIFVEYNGEQDEVEQESGSDFEDEIEEHMNSGSEEDMPATSSFRPPRSASTRNTPAGGSTSASRGSGTAGGSRFAGRGSGNAGGSTSTGGSRFAGRGSGNAGGSTSAGGSKSAGRGSATGFMAYFTASGNY